MTEPRAQQVDEHAVPARADAVYTVELDGEAVLLDESEERLHLLNHTATMVWLCLDGHATVADVASDLSDELGAPYDTVLADTLTVVRTFASEGLLAP
jgi:hypothetical protein